MVDVIAEDDASPPNALFPQRDIANGEANRRTKLTHLPSTNSLTKHLGNTSASTSATADAQSREDKNSNDALAAVPVIKDNEDDEKTTLSWRIFPRTRRVPNRSFQQHPWGLQLHSLLAQIPLLQSRILYLYNARRRFD
jgi:hypothetical protein